MDLTGKKLLVLGGNNMSKEIVRMARSMGVRTVVTDWYDVNRSPVKLMADEYWNESIEDYDRLAELIRENHVDGVLTGFTDSYLIPYARICERCGLPCYGTEEQFDCLTDKKKYKKLCREFGVPTIEAYDQDSEDIRYPVLVKPVDGSGSRGISICDNKEQLDAAVEKAKSLSRCGEVLIERYMDGREATVFWMFVDGEYYLTFIGNRHVKHNQSGNNIIPLPVGYTFPASVTPKYIEEVVPNAKKMFSSLGIQNGMMFMQCKIEDGTCYVYDIGYRLSGSIEYKILDKVCGFDPLKMLIQYALTGKMTDTDVADKVDPVGMKPSFNVSCLCAPGTIKEIGGLEEAKALPEVIDVVRAHYAGQTITEQMKGLLTQITVRILGFVDSKELLYPTMEKVHDTITITSEDGANLLLSGIEQSDIDGFVI